MKTVEALKEKYIKFRDVEEKEYTRDFPKPPRQWKVFEKPLDLILQKVNRDITLVIQILGRRKQTSVQREEIDDVVDNL